MADVKVVPSLRSGTSKADVKVVASLATPSDDCRAWSSLAIENTAKNGGVNEVPQ